MKKIACIYYILQTIILPCNVFSQTFTKDYVLDQVPNIPVGNSNQVDVLGGNDISRKIEYSDGLGRPQQSILIQATDDWNGLDLVQPYEYDSYGRQAVHYLPYVSDKNNGTFQENFISDQHAYYQNADKTAHDDRPYSETYYDNSPLNLVVETASEGLNWSQSSGHTKHIQYGFNTAIDQVVKWELDLDGAGIPIGAHQNGYYPDNTLFKRIITDEDGKIQIEFNNVNGKTICKQTLAYTDANDNTFDFSGGTLNISGGSQKTYSSYIIYDDFGRLIYSIPSKAMIALQGSSFVDDQPLSDAIFKGMITATHYDSKGRSFESHYPDNGWEFQIYNLNDQIVLTQNPVQRITHNWIFSKYDAAGRLIVKGTYQDDYVLTRSDMQTILDNQNISTTPLEEYREDAASSIMGYSNVAFPTSNNNSNHTPCEILIVNYYDNYDFSFDPDLTGRAYQTFNSNIQSNIVGGLITAQKTKVLGTTDFLNTVNYYDEKGNHIQQHNQNYIDYPNSWDVINSEYNFLQKTTNVVRTHQAFGNSIDIKTRYWYDHSGRLVDIFKQVNNETEIHMVYNLYNGIGQLVKKFLHYDWVWNDPYLQGIDYRYNIHGWLSSINNQDLSNDGGIKNDDDNDLFGEELFYDESRINNSVFQQQPVFNGSLSAITWRCRPTPYFNDFKARPIHSYVYRYDDFARLTAGYYACDDDQTLSFEHAIGVYNERENYDLLGNILHLTRNHLSSFPSPIDDLEYTYENDGSALLKVKDPAGSILQSDFHDDADDPIEYLYDVNGNLVHDNNKNLSIDYNLLNLIDKVSTSAGSVNYKYDALGNKLCKSFNGVNHYYVNGIEYLDNQLQFVTTEEGRIRHKHSDAINQSDYIFDYFLKDHLGNVRVVLTTEERKVDYYATMEAQNAASERSLFDNVDETRENKPINEPTDPAYSPDYKVSQLDGVTGNKIGVSKVLHVTGDDKIDFDTKYFFDNIQYTNSTVTITDLLTDLANNFLFNPNSPAGDVLEKQQEWANATFGGNQAVNDFLTNAFASGIVNDPNKPQAFLVYLFFDEKFNFYSDVSGVLQVQNQNTLGDLAVLNLKMPDNGYLYVYSNNESSKVVNFNDLQIHHHMGRVIEEDHYYPYGLLIEKLSYSLPDYKQFYKYQDKEIQNDYSQNYLDFGARQYDAVIGRWFVQDPAHQFVNPYRAMGDNPASGTDHDGRLFGLDNLVVGIITGVISGTMNLINNWGNLHGNLFDKIVQGTGYFSGGAIGGFVGGVIAAEGCITCGMIVGSAITSATNVVFSNGVDPLVISFGVGSFNMSNGEFGYLGKPGNSGMENVGYGIGLIGNLVDIANAIPSPSPPPAAADNTSVSKIEPIPPHEIPVENSPPELVPNSSSVSPVTEALPEQQPLYRVEGTDGIEYAAKTPVGSQRVQWNCNGSNSETTIDGITYRGHALDQMQGRGILSPSVVKDALINRASVIPGRDGTWLWTGRNGIRVLTNSSGEVITVY